MVPQCSQRRVYRMPLPSDQSVFQVKSTLSMVAHLCQQPETMYCSSLIIFSPNHSLDDFIQEITAQSPDKNNQWYHERPSNCIMFIRQFHCMYLSSTGSCSFSQAKLNSCVGNTLAASSASSAGSI